MVQGNPRGLTKRQVAGVTCVSVVESLRCELNHITTGGPKPRIYDWVGKRAGRGIPP
nr:MAG TPA: hypothetical protein [Caudoviricetes sp.]